MRRLALTCACAAIVGIALSTSDARADDLAPPPPPPPTKLDVQNDLHSYYGGERASAYVVMALGALAVGGGSVLVTRDSDFARGFGWPLIGLGALEGLGAIFYAFQVGAEIRHYQSVLDKDAAAYRAEELAHMHGTSSRFVFYRLAELALFVGGAATAIVGFVLDDDWSKGIGLGIASIALPFLIIDTINDGRATHYRKDVDAFAPAHAALDPEKRVTAFPPLPATPFVFGYSGRF